jgi:hypothetical protein
VGRWFGAVSAVLACVLMAGGGTGSWWKQTGTTTCGLPALVRVAGHVMPVGNCAGSFWVPAEKVTLHVGEVIDVHMTQEPAGASASRLVPAYPLPHGLGSAVLKRIATSPDKATATYKAQHPGHVTLLTRASCLGPGLNAKVRDNCPVLSVTVIPSP